MLGGVSGISLHVSHATYLLFFFSFMNASLYAIHQWNSMNLLSLILGKKKFPVIITFLALLDKVSNFTNALQLLRCWNLSFLMI